MIQCFYQYLLAIEAILVFTLSPLLFSLHLLFKAINGETSLRNLYDSKITVYMCNLAT